MTEAYTREEFITKFGIDPENSGTDATKNDPLLTRPTPMVPLPRPAPLQKDLSDQQIMAAHTDTPETPISAKNNPITASPTLDRVARDVAAEWLSMFPGTYGTVKGIGETLFKAAKDGLDPNEEAGVMKSIMRDGGDKMLDQHLADKLQEWRRDHPDLGDEDLKSLMVQYKHSKPFFDFMSTVLQPGFETARNWNHWAMETVGDERTPDQLTWVDDVIRVVGSAVVGLPRSVLVKASDTIAGHAIEKVIENTIARRTLRVVEALTPVTLPLTPTTVAANTAVGAAVVEGVRTLTDQPSIINQRAFAAEQQAPNEKGELMMSTAMLGALGVMLRHGRGAKPRVEEFSGGPPRVMPEGNTVGERAGNLLDEFNPVLKHVQKERTIKETDEELTSRLSMDTGYRKQTQIDNAFNGQFPDGTTANVSVKQALAAIGELQGDERMAFLNGLTQRNLFRDRELAEETLTKRIADLQATIAKARSPKVVKAAQERILQLQEELNNVKVDLKASRPSAEDVPTATLKQAVDEFNANPKFAELAKVYDTAIDNFLDVSKRMGVLSDAEVTQFRATRGGSYVPLRENIFAHKTPWEKAKLAVKEWAGSGDPRTRPQGRNTPTTLFSTRSLEGGLEREVVNNPVDPITALKDYTVRMMDNAITNRLRRTTIDALSQLKNYPHKLERIDINGRYQFSANEFRVLNKKGFIKEDAIVIRRDGMIEAWDVGDPMLKQFLAQNPDTVGLAMRVGMMMNRGVHLGATGFLAPHFVIKNIGYELVSGMAQKNAGRSFNPIEALIRLPIGMGKGLYEESLRGMSDVIYKSLASDSFFSQLAASAVGHKQLQGFADRMAKHYWESTAGLMRRYGVLYHARYAHTYEADSAYRKFMSSNPLPASVQALGSPLRLASGLVNAYAGMLDILLNAPKRAFWESNIARLNKQYKGNIPDEELNKLAYETHALTGDLSRRSGNKTLQSFNRIVPYQSVALQGARSMGRKAVRQTAEEARQGNLGKALQFVAYGVAPVATTAWLLSMWDQKSHSYYWEQLTDFQRQGLIYIPHPDVLWELGMHWADPKNNPKPEFDPQRGWHIAMSPEFVPAGSTAVAAMRGMGMLDPTNIPSEILPDMLKGMSSLFGNMTPAFAQAIAAMSGVQIDAGRAMLGDEPMFRQTNPARYQSASTAGMQGNGELPSTVSGVLTAILGTAGTIMGVSADAALQGYKEAGVGTAISTAAKEAAHEYTTRIPDVPLVWNGQEKVYRSTPIRKLVDENAKAMQLISREFTKANPTNRSKDYSLIQQGLVDRTVMPPELINLARDVHAVYARTGRMKELEKERGLLVAQLYNVDTKRVSRSPQERTKTKSDLIKRIGGVERTMRDHQDAILGQLYQRYGEQFEATFKVPFNYKNIAKVIGEGVRANRKH